jgi:hypothetical protein
MASSRQLIASNVLGSTASSVTFNSIPSTFKNLVLRCSMRDTQSIEFVSAFLQVNSITSNYSYVYIRGNAATVASSIDTAQPKFFVSNNNGNTSTTSTYASLEIYIPNYADSTNKVISSDNVSEYNSSPPVYRLQVAGLLSNTAAITSLTMLASTSFATGSSFYLYGISN